MIFREIEVKKLNLGGEQAQIIVSRAMRFDSEITLEFGSKKINGKSIMGLISLGLKKGDKITVIAKGDDQERALSELSALF